MWEILGGNDVEDLFRNSHSIQIEGLEFETYLHIGRIRRMRIISRFILLYSLRAIIQERDLLRGYPKDSDSLVNKKGRRIHLPFQYLWDLLSHAPIRNQYFLGPQTSSDHPRGPTPHTPFKFQSIPTPRPHGRAFSSVAGWLHTQHHSPPSLAVESAYLNRDRPSISYFLGRGSSRLV